MNLAHIKSKASVLLKIPHINALRGVPMPHFTGESAQLMIARRLAEGTPCLIARVGATEGRTITHFVRHRLGLASPRPYPNILLTQIKTLSGYFPATEESVDDFCRLYLGAIRDIDVYASWIPQDALLCPPSAVRVRLIDLDPFFTARKWTIALERKRVVVVSPFTETMQTQFKRRTLCFEEPVLPDMHLSFVQAPMTHCNVNVSGGDWHANLRHMVDSALQKEPQVAVIGAGAYGLPLAAALRRAGVSAVVLGGSTQLLFGIRGTRWENDRQYRRLMNEHWARPGEEERPPGFDQLEIRGGAYW